MNANLRLADSHCHLNWHDFDGDRDEVMTRARGAGVALVLNPGTDPMTSRQAVDLAHRYEGVYAAVGVHPNDAAGFGPDTVEALRELAADPRVVAIGEVGMDFHWNRLPARAQRDTFERQIALADELELPVIVHDRDAHSEVLDALEAAARRLRGIVMHSFSGALPEARRALDMGAYLGIAGPVTYKKADELRDVVRWAPLERLMIETDSPYLTPQPHRGKRNEPGFVRFVAERVAEVKGVPLETVADVSLANACRVFAIGVVS